MDEHRFAQTGISPQIRSLLSAQLYDGKKATALYQFGFGSHDLSAAEPCLPIERAGPWASRIGDAGLGGGTRQKRSQAADCALAQFRYAPLCRGAGPHVAQLQLTAHCGTAGRLQQGQSLA